jgi:ubiquinone/menaquinone biosynthesis C-methylase UbiE
VNGLRTIARHDHGFRVTQLLHVAARLNLADRLADEPQAAAALARTVGADESALRRVLRALVGVGILIETDGAFALTALGRLLRRNVPGSLHGLAVLYGDDWLWRPYGQMLHSATTGQSAFAHVHGMPFYEYLDQNSRAASQFQDAMAAYSRLEGSAIAEVYEFAASSTVVDVGGGDGSLLAALLSAHPSLRGVLFDQPAVVARAEQVFAAAGVASRAAWVEGDFFSTALPDGDVYVLKSVLHNWDDEAAESLLRSCRRPIRAHARLLIAERVVPIGNAPSEAKLFDINMLVIAGGRERTEAEYRDLLEKAGFELSRVIATKAPLSLIEARPVSGRPASAGGPGSGHPGP